MADHVRVADVMAEHHLAGTTGGDAVAYCASKSVGFTWITRRDCPVHRRAQQ